MTDLKLCHFILLWSYQVVWGHSYSEVVSLQLLSRVLTPCCHWYRCKNCTRIARVIVENKVAPFLWPTVYIVSAWQWRECHFRVLIWFSDFYYESSAHHPSAAASVFNVHGLAIELCSVVLSTFHQLATMLVCWQSKTRKTSQKNSHHQTKLLASP